MSPVITSRFSYLGPRDVGKVLLGLVSRRAARLQVASPLSAGITLTTNPQSLEWQAHEPTATVPAGLFDDNLRMVVDVVVHRGGSDAPLLIIVAADDAVTHNGVTRAWSRLLRSCTKLLVTIPGAAHDLSQETNHPQLLGLLQSWMVSPDSRHARTL